MLVASPLVHPTAVTDSSYEERRIFNITLGLLFYCAICSMVFNTILQTK